MARIRFSFSFVDVNVRTWLDRWTTIYSVLSAKAVFTMDVKRRLHGIGIAISVSYFFKRKKICCIKQTLQDLTVQKVGT